MRSVALGLGLIGAARCASTDGAGVAPTDVEVTMNCRVMSDGGLAGCHVLRERPAGYGMAAEALASAEQGRARMQPVGGGSRTATGTRSDFTMRIAIDAEAMTRFRRARTEVSEPRS